LKSLFNIIIAVLFACSFAAAQKPAPQSLEGVLTQMDQAATNFKSAEADFTWDQYQKVVDETDTQKGKIYFRRKGPGDTQMMANITDPDKRDVLYADGKLRLYQPAINQVTEHDVGKNKSEVESFLVLGFGGGGHDLLRSFDVKLDGWETIDGVSTARLQLIPLAPKVKNMFARIVLWVDPARSISLKQQAFEPQGDYRVAHYTNIKLGGKLNDDLFKLKTNPSTKVVRP
jgi:outer membrane lipoprotein-sorting protein